MKRKALYLNYAAVFYLAVMLKECQAAADIPESTEALMRQKKEELIKFVNIVEANSGKCDAMDGCSVNCTRPSCFEYGTRGAKSYKCLEVQNNTFCANCKERNFDFTRSFLRRMDIGMNSIRTVCTHRNLDEAFRNSSFNDPAHFFRVFFGAADGTFRIYPGADEACDSNGSLLVPYDPRTRDWYIDSTYVPKIVTILIDTGFNMQTQYNGESDTYGNKATTTALNFLSTLKKGKDYISIVAFDASGNKRLNDTMICNNDTLTSYTASLNLNIFKSKSITNATATSNAINTAISDLTSSGSPAPAYYLKVVIVLTSGEQIKNMSDIGFTPSSGVYLFMYNFISANRTAQCHPSGRASIEDIQIPRLDNPLYALQSYFTFMASVHKSFMKDQDKIDHGPKTQDFSSVDNYTVTLSKAAFGPSGELLGVVGIDFFKHKIDQQFDYTTIQFESIVEISKKNATSYDTSTSTSTSVCFNHTDACPNLASTSGRDPLCSKESKGDAKIGCCGSCLPGINWKLVGGIIGGVGGFLLILLVIVTMGCCIRRRRRRAGAVSRRQDVQSVDVAKDSPLLAGARLGADDGLKAPGTKNA